MSATCCADRPRDLWGRATPTTASIPRSCAGQELAGTTGSAGLAHLRGLLQARLVAIMAALLLLGFMLTATATAYLMNRDLI